MSATSASVLVVPPTSSLIGTATIGCSGLQTCEPYFGAKLSASAIFSNTQGGWIVPDVEVARARWFAGALTRSTSARALWPAPVPPSSLRATLPGIPICGSRYLRPTTTPTRRTVFRVPPRVSGALPVLYGAVANAAPVLSCRTAGCSDQVGDTLVATPGTWSTHLQPITYQYQWERCFAQLDATHVDPASCYAIPNATHKLYALGFEDVDYYVTAEVTAVDSAGDTLSNLSNSTSLVSLPPAPTVKGTATIGDPSHKTGSIHVGDKVTPSVTWQSPLPLDVHLPMGRLPKQRHQLRAGRWGQRRPGPDVHGRLHRCRTGACGSGRRN